MAQRKKQSLLSGATTLVIATVIVKIIGALYKIPLSGLLGEVGYGYFSGAYNIYTYVYSISMAGFPIAVARLVSENVASNRFRNATQMLRVSKKIFFVIGLFCTLLMIGIAIPYSRIIKAEMNYVSIMAIAPCIFMCCMMSAYRGFYEGLQNMVPTAVSQVIEALGKLGMGLAFSYAIIRYGLNVYAAGGAGSTVFGIEVHTQAQALAAIYPYAAAGAILGVTMGTVLGLLYLMIFHKSRGTVFTREELVNSPAADGNNTLMKQILTIAIPIALGSLIFNISNLIDDITIRSRLAHAINENLGRIKQMYEYSLTLSETADEDIPTYLYGVYNVALNLKNLIPAITMTLGTSAVPAMAALWTSKDGRGVKSTISSVLRVTMLVAFPAGFGMAALAEPIMKLLYSSNRPSLIPIASPILVVCALGIVFFALATPISNMLQAIGRTDVPLKSVVIGSIIKIGFNYILVGNSEININGAAVSSILSYVAMTAYNIYFLLRETKARPPVASVFIKPFICGGLCGLSAWGGYGLITRFITENNVVALFASIVIGAGVYALSLFILKGIAREDVLMLPKGEKIAEILEKFKVLG